MERRCRIRSPGPSGSVRMIIPLFHRHNGFFNGCLFSAKPSVAIISASTAIPTRAISDFPSTTMTCLIIDSVPGCVADATDRMNIFLAYLFIDFASKVADIYIYNIRLACVAVAPNFFKNFFSLNDTVLVLGQERSRSNSFSSGRWLHPRPSLRDDRDKWKDRRW